MVKWLGAVQAQDYYGAKWALGQRMQGATDAFIEKAFDDGAILGTHVRKGKQFTYALLDERAPKTRALARDEALAELTRRYFRSHGPATVQVLYGGPG